MKTYIKIFLIFIFFSCNNKNKQTLNKEKLEEIYNDDLINYKNIICSDVYYRSIKKYNKMVKIEDLSRAYYGPFSQDLKFLMEYDENRELLIEKWVNLNYDNFKEVENFSLKYPNGSLELIKAFDFMNSNDLKKHLDSIKSIIKENK